MSGRTSDQLRFPRRAAAPRAFFTACCVLLGLLMQVQSADANEQLKRAAGEIANQIASCSDKIGTEGETSIPGRMFRSTRRTGIVISPINPEQRLDERIADAIYRAFIREINLIDSLVVRAIIERGEVTDLEFTLYGPNVLDEIHRKFATLEYSFIIFPKVTSAIDGIVGLSFSVVHRGLKCTDATAPVHVRVDELPGKLLEDDQQLPKQLMADLAREFKLNAGVVRRIAILPSVVGSTVLAQSVHMRIEESLVYSMREQTTASNLGVSSALETKRIWNRQNQEFLNGEPRNGDWLAQATFAMAPVPEMRIAIWPRLGGKLFERKGKISITKPSDYQPEAGGLELKLEENFRASRFAVPRFTLEPQRDSNVYCLAYSLDGEAILLLPTLDRTGRPTATRLQRASRPYRFPEGFAANLSLAAENKEDLHDGIVVCWATSQALPEEIGKQWLDNSIFSRQKIGGNTRLKAVRGVVSYLISEIRKLDGATETFLAFPLVASTK
jgi:hypothetical protein